MLSRAPKSEHGYRTTAGCDRRQEVREASDPVRRAWRRCAAGHVAADRVGGRAQPDRTWPAAPEAVEGSKLDRPITARWTTDPKLERSLQGASGSRDVVIRLRTLPSGRAKTAAAAKAQAAKVAVEQTGFITRAKRIDKSLTVVAQTRVSLNAVVARVDAAKLARLAADKSVVSIKPVRDYELDLSETVPYIGSTARTPWA